MEQKVEITGLKDWQLRIINFFGDIFGFEEGHFSVTHGVHSIFIPLDFEAKHVWTKMEGCHMAVCGGNVDKIGHTLRPDGIMFYLDIQSNHVKIEWFAVA